tara:strand:+ start:1803 stop:2390 length:588 start_codon:yes stop_codon:yes gene_type:complete
MKNIRSLCVYCGSSKNPKPYYVKAAADLGHLLAESDIKLVFGGGRVGLMGVVSDACMEKGGQVLGVMTDFLNEFEGGHTEITDLRIVSSMHERKMIMFDESDAFVILPGGLGTLDEAFEVLTWKQVGMHGKPIIFVDVERYWSGLFETFLNHMIENGFVRAEDKKLFTLVDSVDGVLQAVYDSPEANKDFVSKWG